MKKIRNMFLIGIFLVIIAFASALAIPRQATNSNSVVAAEGSFTSDFKYFALSQSGQMLNLANLKNYKSGATAATMEGTLISNKNISFNFKPLEYNYRYLTLNTPADIVNFETYEEKITFISTEKTEGGKWVFDNSSFTFNGETYTYQLTTDTTDDGIDDRQVQILKKSIIPVVEEQHSDLLAFDEVETVVDGKNVSIRTIYITTTITPQISSLTNKKFIFSVAGTTYTFNFEDPIANFNQNSPFAFTTAFLGNGNPDPSKTVYQIPPEETYNKLQLDLINNNYTETNPLFVNVNYNGFKYEFEVYSKEYNSETYLFVNYYDEHKIISDELTTNNQKIYAKTAYLATPLKLDATDNFTVDTTNEAALIYTTDNFSFNFSYAGRYEIEIYDTTYTLGLNNANYYQESFYIKKDNGGTASIDNIYVVAESVDDDFNHKEYIVSGTVLNNNIKFTIKNVESDIDALEKIVITKTIFGNEENVPVPTTYTPEALLKLLQNGEYIELCSDDASYTIDIYEKGTNNKKSYQYTVLKFPKSQFSDPAAGEYIEKTPYKRTKIQYQKFISNQLKFNKRINNNPVNDYDANTTLDKTYLDKFTVIYGKIQVEVQPVIQLDDEGKEVKSDAKTYQFYGVGTITLTINFNGEITTKVIGENDSHIITFADYGTYEIQMKDEMGTQLTTPLSFKVTKSLNTSALVLIILIAIIVVAVVAFVLIARAKIATR